MPHWRTRPHEDQAPPWQARCRGDQPPPPKKKKNARKFPMLLLLFCFVAHLAFCCFRFCFSSRGSFTALGSSCVSCFVPGRPHIMTGTCVFKGEEVGNKLGTKERGRQVGLCKKRCPCFLSSYWHLAMLALKEVKFTNCFVLFRLVAEGRNDPCKLCSWQ